MKKMCAILAMITAFSAIGGIGVFAEETQSKLPAMEEAQQNNIESQYMTISGTIKSITKEMEDSQNKEDATYSILVSKDDTDDVGILFATGENAFIVNSKDGSFMTFDELQTGMKITAITAKNAPMTMSLPPMTNPIGFVVGEENFAATGYFDEEWTSQEIMLQLNISEETKIVDSKGTKKVFTQEDVQNQDCLVLYGITTRSIPAQTNPVFVMILEKSEIEEIAEGIVGVTETKNFVEQPEQAKPEPIQQPQTEVPENKEQQGMAVTEPLPLPKELPEEKLVPLREMAEKEGYTVTWTGNDKPVLLQKEDATIEITVGQKEYKKGNEILQSQQTAQLIQSKIYVGSDVLK